ncbi:hypothetical protein Bpfe_028433 [Biomphalaria pfeifferi]|uniref:Ubiquitin-like domain-containing protein n=1 Tax=Biomphalaria pfeifferi TaxID=112525 RepID=A0AAD8EVQ2_BIOPF|nr:hypothetical protein Bpfe_028433 [Biomphalaria pfeifferi]
MATPGSGESVPCCLVEFYVMTPGGSYEIHQADCLTNMLIRGLKDDFRESFKIPVANQIWKHDGRELNDSRTLKFYGIEALDKDKEKIYVTRSN